MELLSRYRNPLPATETIRLRLSLLSSAWWLIDAAIGSLDEIRYVAQAERSALLTE